MDNTITKLIQAPDIDPVFLSALIEVRDELSDENLRVFDEELAKKISEIEGKKAWEELDIAINAVVLLFPPTAPYALIGKTVLQFGKLLVAAINDKLDHEKLQQAVVLFSTLERPWYEYPLKPEFNSLSETSLVSEEQIEEINWNVSSRLYQALFVTSRMFEVNSYFTRILPVGADRKASAESYRESLIKVILGLGDDYTTLGRFAGRPSYKGTYIGFVPMSEIGHLLTLTNYPDEVFSHGVGSLIFNLASPGELGVIDPVGRKIGTFAHEDGDGDFTTVNFNEIPGATYSGSNSHPKEMLVPYPVNGNYEIHLTGTGTGPYTLRIQALSPNNEVVFGREIIGVFEPGSHEDGVLNVNTYSVDIVSTPLPRGTIIGTVTDSVTGNPIENAKVITSFTSSFTDSDGMFELADLIPETLRIQAEANGYQTFISAEISLTSGDTITQNIQLVPLTPICNNNSIEGNEVCDGTDLGGKTCVSQGYNEGVLACLSDCSGFDTSGCIGIDTDGDGIPDGLDNCPCHDNPDQIDSDENGIGDVCEDKKGDIDDDGDINVGDIQKIINIILEIPPSPTYCEFWAADCNNDHILDVCDVQIAINKFLEQ